MRIIVILVFAAGLALAALAVQLARGQFGAFEAERNALLARQADMPPLADVVVVSRALKDIGPHLRHNKALFVSINITTADVTDPDFKVFLEEELDNAGVERQQIVLEITERSTADHRVLKDALVRLREYGYRIALDDFGTGYSNLDYLSKLSFDFIKIDKIFTDAIGTESVSFNMLKMMLEMLTHTGATIIVEGIEEQPQADFLLSHSPTVVGQGWLYGRPVEVEKL